MGKKTSPEQIEPLSSFTVLPSYFFAFQHITALKALFPYLRTVIFDFFLLQFTVKWGWRKIEIINVDHPLDETVPFTPSKVGTYLDFVNFWIRPLSMLVKRFGKKALPYMCEYLTLINTCYTQAAEFYKFRMTTTTRPLHKVNRHFTMIRTLDPHYLCVPSLHISIVVLAYNYFRDVFEKENFSDEEKAFYNKELYDGAIAIAETVLYIKQHSVNCIPAALYMMTTIIPDKFTIPEAVTFMDNLFVGSPEVEPQNRQAIREHLHHLFEQLLLEGCNEDNWIIPMKRWLLKYQAEKQAQTVAT